VDLSKLGEYPKIPRSSRAARRADPSGKRSPANIRPSEFTEHSATAASESRHRSAAAHPCCRRRAKRCAELRTPPRSNTTVLTGDPGSGCDSTGRSGEICSPQHDSLTQRRSAQLCSRHTRRPCSACFIRSRSGIANSLSHPLRGTQRREYNPTTAIAWLLTPNSGQPAEPRSRMVSIYLNLFGSLGLPSARRDARRKARAAGFKHLSSAHNNSPCLVNSGSVTGDHADLLNADRARRLPCASRCRCC
jgi:hypothetical protein